MSKSLVAGAFAGVVATVVFALIHDLLISDIWFSLVPMLVAGAICGCCVAWSYQLSFDQPSVASWIRFNLVYTGMFAALAPISIAVFEPVTTVAAVLAANEAPTALILMAVPLTIGFTLAAAALIGWIYGRSTGHRLVLLLTTTILVLTLGLNVSILGLVDIPSSAFAQVVKLFLLIVALDAVYAGAYVALRKRSFPPAFEFGGPRS